MPDTYTTIHELPDLGAAQSTDRIAVDRLGAAVSAGAFVVDQAYQIVTVGSTNFTAIGAAANTVGAYFVATGAGSGSGTAAPINTGDLPVSAIAALATKSTVGLANVDNTSDVGKPISAATQAALDGKASAGAIGFSGLTMAAGVLGRESGTGGPVVLTLSGLSIVNGVLTVTAGGSGTVTSVGLSTPTGLSVTGSPITTSGTLAIAFAAGYSLPTTATQAGWDAAAVLAGTAVQPAGLASTLTGYVQTGDARLSDSREWSATTIGQAEAEAGSATTRRAFTAQRVFQAAAAWWAATATATGQALATAANAAAARTTLGLGTAATAASGDFAPAAQGVSNGNSHNHDGGDGAQIAYNSLSGLPTIPTLSSSAPQPLGATAAAGSSGQAADAGHVHQRDTDVYKVPVGDEGTAITAGTNKIRFKADFTGTLVSVRAGVNTAPTGSTLIVDINKNGASMLGTKLSIDATETSSTTAASAATITTTSITDDDEISIDIDQIGSTVAGAGLKVSLFVRRA